MINETPLPKTDPMLEGALAGALALIFRAPAVPTDLRAQVLAAVVRDGEADWERRRHELKSRHRISIARLNARYLRGCRDALIAGSAVVITISLTVKPLSHGLAPFFDSAAPIIAGTAALGLGVLCGATILQDLFGRLKSAGLRA